MEWICLQNIFQNNIYNSTWVLWAFWILKFTVHWSISEGSYLQVNHWSKLVFYISVFLYAFHSVLIMLLSLYFKTVCELQTFIQMILTHPKIRKFLICMKVTKMPIKDGFLLISQNKMNFWKKKYERSFRYEQVRRH